ncbi:phage protein NinX family protein [Rosenbergiella metrosideri]|uniref:phage protein NinX family protein n=1 Tax=Rosenbergiella metrosideri TaxID=2921185 RepID=UPI001F502D11|nr:phage protein NinX family protein [Rosenbergiella metrosideri]
MMNYQEMSDRSIDIAVFQAIFGKDVFTKDADLRRAWERGISYCNSWANAGKIAQEHKISIHAPRFGEGWMAEHTESDEDVNDGFEIEYLEHHHQNPLRAICIVFLMMKGGE